MVLASVGCLGACAASPQNPGAEPGSRAEAGQTGQAKRTPAIERVTLANGIVIEDVQVGTGEMCLPGSWIRVRYSGKTPDGAVVDSSGDQTLVLHLPRMIRGWQDGLPGMRVGGRRRLTVPPDLGYGSRDMKNSRGEVVIPANSTLVYEVDLMGVQEQPPGSP